MVEELRAVDWVSGLRIFCRVNRIVRIDILSRFVFECLGRHVGADHRGHHDMEEQSTEAPPFSSPRDEVNYPS